MEALAVAASVVGIAVPALHATRLLLDDIRNIAGAPEEVTQITQDLTSLETALVSLDGLQTSELQTLGQKVVDDSKTGLESCTQACGRFRASLEKWTKHSEDGKLAWQDRIKIGFFKEKQVKAFSGQLQSCKGTVNMMIGLATLQISVQQAHVSDDMKAAAAVRELELKATMESLDGWMTKINQDLMQLAISPAQTDAHDSAEDKAVAQRETQDQQTALFLSRHIMEEMLKRTEHRTSVTVTNLKQAESGKIYAGMINTQGKYAGAEVKVDNVEAGKGSTVVAGIAEGVDFSK